MRYINRIIKLSLLRRKKTYVSLSVVLIMALTLLLSTIIFYDSLNKTEEEQRKLIYGSWHAAVYNADDTAIEKLKGHATIQEQGYMTAFGSVLDSSDSSIGMIGTIDQTTLKIGNITLLNGSFPVNEGEIAVEMSYLSRLDFSYELGQKIPLRIMQINMETKEISIVNKTYTLTGVIKNYSNFWKKDMSQVISFFVKDKTLSEKPPLFNNIFITFREKYNKNAAELTRLVYDHGFLVLNGYTYFILSNDNVNGRTSLFSSWLIILLTVIASFFFFFNILNNSLRERIQSFIIMRSIGATKGQIASLFSKEILIVTSISLPIGILSGFLFPYSIYLVLKHIYKKEVFLSVNITFLLACIGIMLFAIILSGIFTLLFIGKIPLRGSVAMQVSAGRIRRKDKFKPLTLFNMIRIFKRMHRRESLVSLVLTVTTFLIIILTTYNAIYKYKEYSLQKTANISDYDYGFLKNNSNSMFHMQEKELEQIKNTYGVEYVRAYQCLDYMPVTWNGIENSEYAQRVGGDFFLRFSGDKLPKCSVIGLSEDERDYSYYMDEIDEGSISLDSIISGQEVILFLPSFYQAPNGEFFINEFDSNKYAIDNSIKSEEHTIKPGDYLVIKGKLGNVKVRVGGIIRDFSIIRSQETLDRPYSMIGSNALCKKLLGSDYTPTFEYVQVFGDKKTNYIQTDIEMSKIKTELYFENIRANKEELFLQLMVSAFMALIISFSIILLVMMIQLNSNTSRINSEWKRIQILNNLGMTREKIILMYLYEILKNCIISIIFGMLALIAIHLYWVYTNVISPELLFRNMGILNIIRYLFDASIANTYWFNICTFFISFLLINIFTMYYPLSKVIKQNKNMKHVI